MRLTCLKDALISEYEGRLARWHIVQGAALAAASLAVLGYSGGSIGELPLGLVLTLSAGAIAAATQATRSHEAAFEKALDVILRDLERLKRRGTPS